MFSLQMPRITYFLRNEIIYCRVSIKAEFVAGNTAPLNYAYYLDNLRLVRMTGSPYYTSAFTVSNISSQNTDGWSTSWATSYMNVLTGSPNKLRVAGETPAIQRNFDVTPNDNYELTYTQTENNSVTFTVEQSSNGTTGWSTLMNTTSTNGTHTRNFTPTQAYLRVKYSGSAAFSLASMTLASIDVDTSYSVVARGGYRYAFQGQERDDEIKGAGNSYNYEYRMHDPRLGRFFAIDPLTSQYPWYTPYQFSGNKVIHCVELEGLEEYELTNTLNKNGEVVKSEFKYNEDAKKLEDHNSIYVINVDIKGNQTTNVMKASEATYVGDQILPTKVPEHILHTKHYYWWRNNDFKIRHSLMGDGKASPDYYMNYGDKYVNRFKNETRPKLSDNGKLWLDQTLRNLQDAVETLLLTNPNAEENNILFRQKMFAAHPDAYESAGLFYLPDSDLYTIGLTPDSDDLLSREGLIQVNEISRRWKRKKESEYKRAINPMTYLSKIPSFIPQIGF